MAVAKVHGSGENSAPNYLLGLPRYPMAQACASWPSDGRYDQLGWGSIVEHSFGNLKQWAFWKRQIFIALTQRYTNGNGACDTSLQPEKSHKCAGNAEVDGLKSPFVFQNPEKQMPRQVGAFAFNRGRLCFHTACMCRVFVFLE